MSWIKRTWVSCAGAALACLVIAPAAAQASIGFTGLTAAPTNKSAGAHSNFNVHIGFSDPADQVKDLTVHLPPGLVGDPTATPLCSVAQLNGDNCPAASEVGSVTAHVNVIVTRLPPLPDLSVPLTVNGNLYNLVAQTGEPARFGIVLRPTGGLIGGTNIIQQSAAKLRTSDFGLDTVINNFPRTASGLETDISSLDITLDGHAANGHAFMRNPTGPCNSGKTVKFDATSYGGHSASGSAPSFTPTNCGALDFSPTLTASVGAQGLNKPGAKAPLTTSIDQDGGEAGLLNAQVLLPSAVGADIPLLNNTCSVAQFHAENCPPASIVGLATATSPLLSSPLTGPVVIVAKAQETDPLPRLGVDLRGALSLKLIGSFVLTSDGAGNVFQGLPDIPIAHFALRFHGGPGGLIAASTNLCKLHAPDPSFLDSFDGYNGAHKEDSATAKVVGCGGGGGNGGGHGGGRPPKASLTLTKLDTKHPKMRFKLKSGSAPLRKASLKLPKQLRFAGGKAWSKGAKATDGARKLSKSHVHHSNRKLKLSSRGLEGTRSFGAKIGKGALLRAKTIKAGDTLKFPIGAKDVDGRSSSFKVALHVH